MQAKQTKTHDDPHRVLADLLLGLSTDAISLLDPAERVIQAVAGYDRALAESAGPAIRSVFGTGEATTVPAAEQVVVSALVLLIVARSRHAPLIVHVQDLHWCNADVLQLLARLTWQLGQVQSSSRGQGILLVFEGRTRESQGDGTWSSAPFETFLDRSDRPTVTCGSFTADDGAAFVRRLFEQRHSTPRLVADDLLQLQTDLVERIHRAAGGNPFHSLEQVQLLKDRRVLGQNPTTGLLYLIRPDGDRTALPESVFASIRLRWEYLRERRPELALLLWSCALLEDRLPTRLFRRLWHDLAPNVSVRDVDATDMLWTGDGQAAEVVFRHENYFEAIRRFGVPDAERQRAVDSYCRWFAELRRPSPVDRFRWARVVLEHPAPDVARADALLATALRRAHAHGDARLARRITAFRLDLAWSVDDRSPLPFRTFLRRCDDDLQLARELLESDREQGASRLSGLRRRLQERLDRVGSAAGRTVETLRHRQLAAEVVYSQVLYNHGEPAHAAEVAVRAVDGIRLLRASREETAEPGWEALEMDALYSQACAQAISGEVELALGTAERAAEIAMRTRVPRSRGVISTYGNILIMRDARAAEAIQRECLAAEPGGDEAERHIVEVHLTMALVLQAYRCGPEEASQRAALLDEARDRLTRVFTACNRLGIYVHAGAAALMRGIVSALADEDDEVWWFAQAVAAATRGRQMETLWRSHINLATALYRSRGRVTDTARDHAAAALDIMEDTLSSFAQPDRSPRFELLRVPMANAVRFLLGAGDERGTVVLERYPALRVHFRDPVAGVLSSEHHGRGYYEWLHVGDGDYVLY